MTRERAAVAGPVASVVAFGLAAGTLAIRSVDYFWHLVAGRWILAERAIPSLDPFRFSHDGAPWIDHEWLFQVALAASEQVLGPHGPPLLRLGLVLVLALVLYYGARRRGAGPSLAASLAIVAVFAARGRFYLRPELVSALGVAGLLALLGELLRAPRRMALWLALGILLVGWANCHPGALAAPVLVAAFVVGARLDDLRTARTSRWSLPMMVGLPSGTAFLLLLNPYREEIFLVPARIAAALEDVPGVNPDWNPAWVDPRPLFFALALAWLAWIVYSGWVRGRVDLATTLPALATLGLALLGARHQPLFFVAAAFSTAAIAGSLRPGPAWLQSRAGRLLPGLLALTLGAWCVVAPSHGWLRARGVAPRFGWGLQPGLFPDAVVDRLAGLPAVGHLYHEPVFGGYLLWRLFPERQVFVDTRNEVDPDLLREIGRARRDGRAWQELLASYDIDAALVRYDERPVPIVEGGRVVGQATIHSLLFPRNAFALVDWDDRVMLFLRRTEARAALLEDLEYRWIDPEGWRPALALGPAEVRDGWRSDLRRKLAADPGSRRAAQILEALDSRESEPAPGSRPSQPDSG